MKTIIMETTLNLMLINGQHDEVNEIGKKCVAKRTKTDVGYIIIGEKE